MSPVAPKSGKKYPLEQLQEIVGGYIQVVRLDASTVLVCDDDGKYKGYEVNGLATMILRDAFKGSMDFIVGNVLVCKTNEID